MGLAWAFAGVVAISLPTAGDNETLLALQFDACSHMDQASVRKLVAIELGFLLDEPRFIDKVTQVNVTCGGGAVLVALHDPENGTTLDQEIDLGPVAPKARARLLALSIAELVAVSRLNLPDLRPRAVERTVPARTAEPESRPWHLGATLVGRIMGRVTTPYVGGGLDVGYDLAPPFALSLDVLAEHASGTTGTGTVQSLLLSSSLGGWLVGKVGVFDLSVGGGGRLGWAQLTGTPRDPDLYRGKTLHGPWGGPWLAGRIRYPPGAPLRVDLAIELGWVTLPIRALAGPETTVAIRGGWARLALSFGVGL